MLRERQQQLEIDALLDYVFGVVNKNVGTVRRDPKRPNTPASTAPLLPGLRRMKARDSKRKRNANSCEADRNAKAEDVLAAGAHRWADHFHHHDMVGLVRLQTSSG